MILKCDKLVKLLREGFDDNCDDPFSIKPLFGIDTLERGGSASIDLRLGCWFLLPQKSRITHLDIGRQSNQEQKMESIFVPFGNEFILHPRGFALAVTLEWLRIPKNYAGYVIGKSSWGRRGLIIATAVGIHPGFTGCLTLELSNVGEIPISLNPGIRICQLFLHDVDTAESKTFDKTNFFGQRKPSLGKISIDAFAETLAKEFKSRTI